MVGAPRCDYDKFLFQREQRVEALTAAAERQQKEIDRMQGFIDRLDADRPVVVGNVVRRLRFLSEVLKRTRMGIRQVRCQGYSGVGRQLEEEDSGQDDEDRRPRDLHQACAVSTAAWSGRREDPLGGRKPD